MRWGGNLRRPRSSTSRGMVTPRGGAKVVKPFFSKAVLREIKKKWVDTGKVKLIYRDFPLDQTALKAAQLAECAGKDKYFGVIDMIFSTQARWAAASDPIGELAKSLRIAGMGDAEVKACLAN